MISKWDRERAIAWLNPKSQSKYLTQKTWTTQNYILIHFGFSSLKWKTWFVHFTRSSEFKGTKNTELLSTELSSVFIEWRHAPKGIWLACGMLVKNIATVSLVRFFKWTMSNTNTSVDRPISSVQLKNWLTDKKRWLSLQLSVDHRKTVWFIRRKSPWKKLTLSSKSSLKEFG